MNRKFLYTVKTIDGQRTQVEATDSAEAIRLSGFDPATIKKFYPFPVKALLTEEEKAEQQKRFVELKRKKEEKEMSINKTTGELEADFIRRQLVIKGDNKRWIEDLDEILELIGPDGEELLK